MSSERKLSLKKYLLAFFLTLLVFSGGIVVGITLENARLSSAEQITLQEKVSLRSLQLQHNYIDSGITDCKTLNTILENNINELGKKVSIIIDYEKKAIFSEEEFNLQLQDYFLTEIQFYLLAQEIEQKCPQNSVKILYFYDENRDDTQGDILAYLKKRFGNRLLIFSLNSQFPQEPMINIFLTYYKITQYPAVVIEEEVYQGHRTTEQLMDDICKEFIKMGKNIPTDCVSSQKN
ncbi:MAG: hypothetical protein A2822_01260 [Candidatus Staskawiczbacteria bacterium RIFCSPHIGHO2_01_FULL_41_41]|uniref:Thioredoxin-like fold domain-containing protein n=1 Tax=Candidatus Staskawiczbacteria bacterium RIFCSPHIGHO2_01_FULL_41_41 TaxID=1802203 RepID=A0A1G2HUA6_9BACT|nr:MAG: hypothetical protein A2822_01260 [Candidatus Staskawiczbacteria bacterium RIFCSPHIGHO2_01_FULL_41_41]HLD79974.1 hypothetical protein [Candidatus Nanoarchaeia archaeon]